MTRPAQNFVSALLTAACIGLFAPAATAQYTWTNYTTANGLGNNAVNAVYAIGSTIYAATGGGGLSVSTDNGSTWTNYTTANGLENNFVYGVYAQGDTIYAATDGGLSVSADNGATWTNYTLANGLGTNSVNAVYAVGDTIYAATGLQFDSAGGLSVSTDNGTSWTNYTTANGLGSNDVLSVYAQGDTIYAATYGGLSVSTDNGSTWTNYTFGDANDNLVDGVYAIGDTIYAATYGGLSVGCDNGSTWTTLTANGLGSNTVYGVYVQDDTIYAATDGGLSVSNSDGASWTNYTMANGLGSTGVRCVYAIGSTIYAATLDGGLSIGVPPTGLQFTNYTAGICPTSSSNISSNDLSSVDVAHGVICVGSTDAGVSVSSGPITSADSISWISASTSNGLGSNYVTSVQVGEDFLVAGTTGGVSVSTDGGLSWTNSTTADGLADDEVLAVYVHNGDIYAATPGGLSISTDQGASWTSPKSTLNLPLSDVYVETVLYQGQLVDAVYFTVPGPGGSALVSFDGLATTIELNNQCGDYPYGTPSPYYLVVQGGKIYGFDGQFLGDAVVSEACDPSCDYECGWSKVPPWCGYVTDIELVGPDRWFATPTAGGLAGGLVFNPTGVTYSSCGTATRTFTTADGLGSNNCIAVSVGDGLVCVATDSGVSVASLGQCPGDFDLDGIIGGGELAQVLAYFGTPCDGSTPEACVLDLDGSGIVDAGDIAVLLEAWGSCE